MYYLLFTINLAIMQSGSLTSSKKICIYQHTASCTYIQTNVHTSHLLVYYKKIHTHILI